MPEEGPERISKSDIWAEVPEKDGTELIVQRHEEYIRDENHPERGSLTAESAIRANRQAYQVFKEMMQQIPEGLRQFVDVMVVGSPTQYMEGGRRSMETAKQNLAGIQRVMDENQMSQGQLLNNQDRLKLKGQPIVSKDIVEPKIFNDNPDFVEWLKKEYGNGKIGPGFFKAYEQDLEPVRSKRLEAGAEGPMDMADRLGNYLYALKLFSANYHQKHPGRRLIIWTDSHYDTISPFVKSRIGGGNEEGFMGVDYGGGFAVNLKPDGTSTTKIGGKTYPISLVKAATASS